ncbi:MAG: stage sporulation protein [Myxococcales bacterium]|nr:stage sporulation protein [Myxococcales bacterium]
MKAVARLPAYLADIQREIEGHARGFGLDFWEVEFEILDYKRMQEVAAFGGFPVRYPHWRFGMEFEHLSKSHIYGFSKIYEMVINNNPAYAYLLEGNSLVDQKMVIAHVLGHVDFFKNNYFFSKTDRRMIDGMANHATRVRRHMERLGIDKVESFIDSCLCLENLIDPMSPFITRHAPVERADKKVETPEIPRMRAKSYMDKFINPPAYMEEQRRKIEHERDKPKRHPAEPERDVLLFLLQNAPLDPWERDILEIIRDEAYYFAPQRQTKVLNEGWAAYWHSKIMTERTLKASEIIDYADHNAGVLATAPGQWNPYKVGIELLRHVEERWDKGRFGREWNECQSLDERRTWDLRLGLGRKKIFEVRKLYNDVTFIDEFFTIDFCEQHKFFSFSMNERSGNYEIDSREFQKVKNKILFQLTNFGDPFILVEDANHENRGELLLQHRHEGIDLDVEHARATLAAMGRIWRRPVNLLTTVDSKAKMLRYDGKEHTDKSVS